MSPNPPKPGTIDIVVNPLTPRIVAARPAWTREFRTRNIGRAAEDVASVTLEQMDAAGIERVPRRLQDGPSEPARGP